MKKYKNKYRIESTRLKNWDYGWNGAYFITICTKNHDQFFGKIVNKKMHLNEIGRMTHNYWYEIPQHFLYINFSEFVVMPNHIHGIINIDKTHFNNNENNTNIRIIPGNDTTIATKMTGGFAGNKNPMINDNLSKVIRWYKGRVTFEARKANPSFCWQARFYDHIIRDERSFHSISIYIHNNPINWNEDKFYENNGKTPRK